MTARVVSLNVTGNLDGLTLVEEFPQATVGNTQPERDLSIYTIDYEGDLGVFRMDTLMRAIKGYESADSYFPQIQFQPGPFAQIDFLVLGPELTGAGIRVPIVNANAGCVYTERRGGWRIRSSNQGGSHKIGMFMSPLTTQDQIIQASCCFCESVRGQPCVPIVIDGVRIEPTVPAPGFPPAVTTLVPFDVALGSSVGSFTPTDVFVLQNQVNGAIFLWNGPASTFNDSTSVELNVPTPTAAQIGVYRLVVYRAGNPNCGVAFENFLVVVAA